ncbi:MAG: copper amine oxidase N-terminal domain-containing protein [Bacillota bacterium]|nr:copper amine oxidase N-terminal domain-containing protein [Bacillota bacterium]
MKKQWMCLILALNILMINSIPILKAEAADTAFNGTYQQVQSFLWEADGNAITFYPDNTFTITINMYEGFYHLNGCYSADDTHADCIVTGNEGFKDFSFTMRDINGNLVFESENKLVTVETGAVFRKTDSPLPSKEPWEDAYLELIKGYKNDNSSFNFALYDVDENGTPELFLAAYGFYNVFTYKNGACVDLGTVNAHLYQWGEKNSFITFGGMGTGASGAMLFKLENDQLSEGEILFYSEQPYETGKGTFIFDGKEVTEDEYQASIDPFISPANSIYTFYCDKSVCIPAETRLADYVTLRKGSAAQKSIGVMIDGRQISFDQPPALDNGRTLVPLRAIFEALGAVVSWNESTQTVTAVKGNSSIIMRVGDPVISVNDKRVTLDVAPKVVNGRTLVPVRAVAEGFSAGVDWDDNTQTVFITSDFYRLNVNNLVKNKAFTVFSNPIADDGHKIWEYNYKDDLNMNEKEYREYVYLTSVGAALVETGADLADFDFADLFGSNNKREAIEDAITRLLVPTQDELKTMLQKNLEAIETVQENGDNFISFSSDIIELYKEVKGSGANLNQLIKDVGGEFTDFGLTVGLSTTNDTLAELILLKTIADTYNIVGENYEAFIGQLSATNNASADKELIVSLSKGIIEKYKESSKDQIISAMKTSALDNTIKESIKWIITNGFSADKITSLSGTIYLAVLKFFAKDFIEATNSWLAFSGMNSIQSLAATEYEMLLAQAKGEKMPLSKELEEKMKNAALVYTMSSIKCRDLLLDTVVNSHTNQSTESLKNRFKTRNDLAYQAFFTWKKAQVSGN